MANTERYTTVIELNSEQAKRELDRLKKEIDELEKKKEAARKKPYGDAEAKEFAKQLKEKEKELRKYDNEVMRTIDTLNNLGTASVKQIENAQRQLRKMAKDVPHNDEMYEKLNGQLDKVTQELENIKATKAFEQMQKEASGATKSAAQLQAELDFIKQTADNAETASVKQLQLAERSAENIKNSSQKGSETWEKAISGLEKVHARLTAIDEEEKKVVKTIDRYNEELKKAGKEEKKVADEMELVKRTLDKISSASVRDLEYSIKILNEQLRDTERTGGNVEELTKKLKKLNEELKKVQDMQKPDDKGGIFTRSVNFLNKNWGAITQIIGMYSGLHDVVKGSVEAFAQMDQEMNSVRKYTGQTIEEVQRMNEAFKEMDTRTPREQLNQLAGAAGRLGVQGREAIMDFVYAADQINLALGDDLGQGAVDKIGKLAMAFGEDDNMGLRDAMLSTGSAVNELAQNSAANAGYLVEFAARLSGVGVQAGLTQAQILGLGAAMDENMQKDEMAATALSQIITKMTTDSETFARIAGKNIEEFARLVKTDMNAALMQFFEAMNRKGGFTELAPLFEQMGLDGTRAIGVLSTLAAKIDDVRSHQLLATEAYEKHTSVEAEAAIQNDTYQAKLEKARKRFQDLRIELGEKLLPVASAAIGTTSMMVRALEVIVGFVLKYKSELIAVTAAIAAYNVVAKVQAHWTAIVNSSFITAFKSVKNFRAATQAMGVAVTDFVSKLSFLRIAIAGVVGVLAGLLAKLVLFKDETESLSKTVQGLNEAEKAFSEGLKEARRSVEEDEKKLRTLIDANGDATETVRELAEKYPQLVREQMTAVEAYDALVKGSRAYCEQMALEKKAMALDETIKDNEASLHVLERQLENATRELKKQQEASYAILSWQEQIAMMAEDNKEKYLQEGYVAEDLADKVAMLTARVEKLRYDNQQLGEAMSATNREMETQARQAQYWAESTDLMAVIYRNISNAADTATEKIRSLRKTFADFLLSLVPKKETGEQTGPATDTKEYWQQQLDERKAKLDALRADAASTAKDVEEAAKAVKEAESKMQLFTPTLSSVAGAGSARDLERERREQLRKANDAAKAETEQQLAELTHRYAMGRILYCDYIDEQERIQLEGIERRMLIYSKESLEYQKLNRQREELLLNGSQESQKLTMAQMKADHEQRLANIEELAWREQLTEQEKNEMVFEEDMRFMDEQRILYRKGTLERINLEHDIEERDQQHRLQRQQYYQQQLEQAREQLLGLRNERQKQLALKGLEEMYNALKASGLIQEREYQEMLLAVRAQYANYQSQTDRDQKAGANALKIAQSNARQQLDQKAAVSSVAPAGSGGQAASLPIVGDIMLYQSTMEQLRQMYQSDELTHAQYLAAKQQATAQFCESLAAQMQTAYNTVNQVMSAASSYFSAQQEYETAQVQKKYEKQIEAAGSNQKKVKKLQEQQQKEEAAVKTKYAKRAAAIQMAQAVAQTAISAINAYSSAAAIPVTGFVLAPIAAAAAIAAGMLQIATIKKQQQAQEAGFYEGGFTHGRHYRKEAGVVHEGEFVANHQAVNNPAVLPFLHFLDQAQRNNTVGSLTAADVSRSMGAGAGASPSGVIAPIVNVQTDNEELRQAVEAHREATELLLQRLEQPINAQVVLTGPDGLNAQQQRLDAMMKNK
ncbi:MAG: phage tail tape measure protein [Prevotella sp.]|nr:phage tail tape measure protein [Prevotella sp.]